MSRHGSKVPAAYLLGTGCTMGKGDSLIVLSSSKPTPNVSPVLFGGPLQPGNRVTCPMHALGKTFILVRIIAGRSGTQWRNFAVVCDTTVGTDTLLLSKLLSEEGDLCLSPVPGVSAERLAQMEAALPSFLANMTVDSARDQLREPPRRSIRQPPP